MFKKIEFWYFGIWFIAICILWSHLFYFDGTNYVTQSKDIWADWTSHIPHIINYSNRPFPLEFNPQFYGDPFRYHYAANAFSGMLMTLGFSLTQATVLPSIISMELLIIALYAFFYSLYKNKIIAILSSVIFLFNGGVGIFIYVYYLLVLPSKIPELFTSSSILTRIDLLGIRWANIFITDFIPQRAFLLGAPIALMILSVLWKIYAKGIHTISKIKLFSFGFLSGLLPVVHLQSFFVIFLQSCFILFFSLYKNRTYIKLWIWFIGSMLIVSSLLLVTTFTNIPTSGIRWEVGSLRQSYTSMPTVLFWIVNLGAMSILIPLSFMFADIKHKVFYIPFVLLFIVSNLITFQIDPWDNRKFLIYWYIVSSGFVGSYLYKLFSVKQIFIPAILLYLITVAGFIDVLRTLNPNKPMYKLFSEKDMEFAKTIRSKTQVDDVFLTAPTNTHITLTLGRQTVMSGYTPWLATYGHDVKQREKEIAALYTGQDAANDLVKKFSIDYIVVGQAERSFYNINESWFQEHTSVFLTNENNVIYKVLLNND